MKAITELRLARLRKAWTLDDLFLRSEGKLSPARVSRIERGLCAASAEELSLLVVLLGVTEKTVTDCTTTMRFIAVESATVLCKKPEHGKTT